VTDDVEPACYYSLQNAWTVEIGNSSAENREKCEVCFPNGEVLDGVDELVVSRYSSKVHLPDEYDVDYNTATPDEPCTRTEGLAAKLGADDYGPEDVGLSTNGGDT